MSRKLTVSKDDFSNLIDMDINSNLFEIEGDMSDSVETQMGQNQPSDFTIKEISREQYIFFLLGHITLNPSKEDNRDLLNAIYVYKDEAGKYNENYPNWSFKSADSFLNELIKAAKNEANERKYAGKGYGIRNRKIYLIHGPSLSLLRYTKNVISTYF